MRVLLVGGLLAALAGCATPEPSVERTSLKAACQSGDTYACAVVLQADTAQQERNHQRRLILAQGMQNMSNAYSQGYRTTNCTPGYGGSFSCSSY